MSTSGRKAWVLSGITLLATLLLGVSLGYLMMRRGPRQPGVLVSMNANAAVLFLNRATLLDSLGLDSAQRGGIDSVLRSGQDRVASLMDSLQSHVRVVTSETRQGVRDRLSEQQRVRFDSLLAAASPVRTRNPVPASSNP